MRIKRGDEHRRASKDGVIYRPVAGLDLSLKNSAAVLIPATWKPGGDWGCLAHASVGYGKTSKDVAGPAFEVARAGVIVDGIVAQLVEWKRLYGLEDVYVEDYAFGLASTGTRGIAEVTGCIKLAMYRLDIIVQPLNQSTVRKFFLGKLPTRDRATVTHQTLRLIGAPFASGDLGDAFLVANLGRTELGMSGLSLAR